MSDKLFAGALSQAEAGQRLKREEIVQLASSTTPEMLHRLGEAAYVSRQARFGNQATYIKNLHINPSNVCEGGCGFCRYSVKPGSEGARTLDEAEIMARVAEVKPHEVHVVGGVNSEWGFARSLELIRSLRNYDARLYIKAFTAVEIDGFVQTTTSTTRQILADLKEAGLNGLPGGGAEIFSSRMRKKYCPDKLSPDGWLDIHHKAHELGLITNATMLFGLDESPEERVDHLLALRDAQDQTRGFSSFIPLAYQAADDESGAGRPTPLVSLMVIALSRLVLDNFPHIKAYWPMIGLSTAAAAFYWGADDLDGTLGGEEIAHAAGAKTPKYMSREQMKETIKLGGFVPVERDGWFNELKREE